MCVIILTNPKHPISKKELKKAWNTNPDGAGLAYSTGGTVKYERGFMNMNHYIKKVLELQDKYDLMLHLRISTGAGITPQGTHPYKAGALLSMKGETTRPLICMNGVINYQELHQKKGNRLNDTASYILDHPDAFKIINGDILNIIAEATGARWAAVTPAGIITGGTFQEYKGRQYSNLNHINAGYYITAPDVPASNNLRLKHLINSSLYNQVIKDWPLFDELEDFIEFHCNLWQCYRCNSCLSEASSKAELIEILIANNGGY